MIQRLVASRHANYRHFKAINTNWKNDRWKPEPIDTSFAIP